MLTDSRSDSDGTGPTRPGILADGRDDLSELLRVAAEEIGSDAASLLSKIADALLAGLAEPNGSFAKINWDDYEVDAEFAVCLTLSLEGARNQEPGRSADALRQLADWAEKRGAVRTAAVGVQLAFALAPDAMVAHRAGSLARRRAEYDRALEWFERTAEVAAQTFDYPAAALACAGRGVVARMKGHLPQAMRWHLQALRIARAHRLRPQEAQALHNLCALAFEQHDKRLGLEFADMALDAYGHDRSRVAALASDLAWIWMTEEGAFKRALPIFEQLASEIHEPPIDRLYVQANLARAAAGAGDIARFEEASEAVRILLPTISDGEGHASALVELAHGAITLGRWSEAIEAAEAAVSIAQKRAEIRVSDEAASILANARSHERVRESAAATQPREAVDDAVDRLALELVRALSPAH